MTTPRRTGIIVQARMSSQRLPGKSLRMLGGKPLVQWCLESCRRAADWPVVCAVPDATESDELTEFLLRSRVAVFRGHPTDLIARYRESARLHGFDTIVRITGDNPLVCPDVIDRVAHAHVGQARTLTTTRRVSSGTFLPLYPKGLSVDVFDRRDLEAAEGANLSEYEREHVIPYFLRPGFHVRSVAPSEELPMAFSVDTPEDLNRIARFIEAIGNDRLPLTYPQLLEKQKLLVELGF